MDKQQFITEREIPVFFSTDDNYIPYLDVAITSLIANASKKYKYRIVVLNTGLEQKNIDAVKRNEGEGFTIDFVDISKEVEGIKNRLKDVYHFSVVTYYRLFISSLFPQYDKIVYLDCDLVVLGDVSELYFTELNGNILGATLEEFVFSTDEFRTYAKNAIGVDPANYINAGVLVIDLEQFRKHRVEERFIELITEYDFDVVDPDQAYLNYLCKGKILMLPLGWNKETLPLPCEGKLNIVHYALYKKPWQYYDVMYDEYFWKYAKASPYYEFILKQRDSFTKEDDARREAAAVEIKQHALRIVNSDNTFVEKIAK